MFFDTHCHLNFEAFDGKVDEVINDAKTVGVNKIVIPGTDIPTSKKAIKIAEKHEGIYAAVGIHPHHVFEIYEKQRSMKVGIETGYEGRSKNLDKPTFYFNLLNPPPVLSSKLSEIEKLLSHPKVVAIGEIGIDRHIYQKTKYPDYKIAEEFVELQKIFFIEQIKLAYRFKKSLIFHNREAKKDMFEILTTNYKLLTTHSSVFHCCEPDPELLEFAKVHKMFIGVDGDITYYKEKQEWIKTVPLEMLVLETDSPFLTPRYNRMQSDAIGFNWKKTHQSNEPKNIPLIAEFVAKLKGISAEKVEKQTTENAKKLFSVSSP